MAEGELIQLVRKSAKLVLDETYLGDKRCNQESTTQNQRNDGRSDKSLGALYVKVLRPHRCPPRVRQMLFVEDIESMCRSTENRNAEGNDEAGDDGLSQMERNGVDLHCKGFLFSKLGVVVLRNGWYPKLWAYNDGIFSGCQPGAPFLSRNEGRITGKRNNGEAPRA